MYIFSNGGGVQSTAALILSAKRELNYPVHVFSNVGDKAENPDTLAYINNVILPYAHQHDIEFTVLRKYMVRGKNKGYADLYDIVSHGWKNSTVIPVRVKKGIPGNRQCTGEFKVKVIAKFIKTLGATTQHPFVLGLGISTDEIHRAKNYSQFDFYSIAYPLIDLGLSRKDCISLIEREGLPIPPKSSCWFCPFKTIQDWKDLKREKPDLFDKAVALERTLLARRERLGKDAAYLSQTMRPLDEVIQLDNFETLDTCESGFCMT